MYLPKLFIFDKIQSISYGTSLNSVKITHFWWFCILFLCGISQNRPFRVPAVPNFRFRFSSGSQYSLRTVLFRFRFSKNRQKPPVPRFRLEPTQLYYLVLRSFVCDMNIWKIIFVKNFLTMKYILQLYGYFFGCD